MTCWEVYYVSNPTEAIGVFGDLHWAVSKGGDWVESFHYKKNAVDFVHQNKRADDEVVVKMRRLEW